MIRDLETKDLVVVNNLLKELNYQIDDINGNPFFKCIIFEDDIIKGILCYQYIYDRIEIDYIIVEKLYRNQGIATKLFNYMEDLYDNLINITLEVNENNLSAISFYEKMGFKKVSIRKKYYKDNDGILMEKKVVK